MVETRYQNIACDCRSVTTPASPATEDIRMIWVELQLLTYRNINTAWLVTDQAIAARFLFQQKKTRSSCRFP